MRHRKDAIPNPETSAGFTLIEVLAALTVLTVGLAAVISMIYGSIRQGHTASDHNAAAMLVSEAVRQIGKEHLITPETASANGILDAEVGLFIQTLLNAPQSDDASPYGGVTVNGNPLNGPGNKDNLNEWPRRPAKPFGIGGARYRVRYRLEKHPDWTPHDNDGNESAENVNSEYRGIFVLTLVCYRDNEGDMSKPVPVSDPAVVYLKDRKAR